MIKLVLKFFAWIRGLLVKRLVKLRSRLRMDSLRDAIGKADSDKASTGRKNLVVFNNHSGAYEAVQKQLMKKAKRKHKVKGQPAQTKFRKARTRKFKPGRFTDDRIKTLEKKSAYVTS